MNEVERRSIVEKYRQEPIFLSFIDLIPYNPSFAEKVIELRNHQRARLSLNLEHKLTLDEQSEWYESYSKRDNDIYWCIVKQNGGCIGTTRLSKIDMNGNICEKGSQLIDEKVAFEKPYALEAELFIIKFAYTVLHMKNVQASIRHDNYKVQSMNNRFMFVRNGSHMVGSVEYYDYFLKAEQFDPTPFEKILDHWAKRGKFKKNIRSIIR